jgi:hypothetical protein
MTAATQSRFLDAIPGIRRRVFARLAQSALVPALAS